MYQPPRTLTHFTSLCPFFALSLAGHPGGVVILPVCLGRSRLIAWSACHPQHRKTRQFPRRTHRRRRHWGHPQRRWSQERCPAALFSIRHQFRLLQSEWILHTHSLRRGCTNIHRLSEWSRQQRKPASGQTSGARHFPTTLGVEVQCVRRPGPGSPAATPNRKSWGDTPVRG